MEVIKKIVGTILLIVLYLSAFGQKSNFYYDFNVDYFPKIVALKFDTSQSIQISTMVHGEFIAKPITFASHLETMVSFFSLY
jgi:hypothetical protein